MSAPSERVEQAAEYLRSIGYKVRLVDEMGRKSKPWTVTHPQGFTFHFNAKYLEGCAKEAGWGGETVSGG